MIHQLCSTQRHVLISMLWLYPRGKSQVVYTSGISFILGGGHKHILCRSARSNAARTRKRRPKETCEAWPVNEGCARVETSRPTRGTENQAHSKCQSKSGPFWDLNMNLWRQERNRETTSGHVHRLHLISIKLAKMDFAWLRDVACRATPFAFIFYIKKNLCAFII